MTTAITFSAKMTLTRAQYSVLRKSHLLRKLKDSRVFHSNSVLVESWKIKIPEFRRDRHLYVLYVLYVITQKSFRLQVKGSTLWDFPKGSLKI